MRHWPHNQQLRQLADLLIVEYAGAVDPDRIAAAVQGADLALDSQDEVSGATGLLVCESLVRRDLTDQLAS